jgi:hypothetical protein
MDRLDNYRVKHPSLLGSRVNFSPKRFYNISPKRKSQMIVDIPNRARPGTIDKLRVVWAEFSTLG